MLSYITVCIFVFFVFKINQKVVAGFWITFLR